MTIRRKLLAGFLFVSLLIFTISFGINLLIQEKIVHIFHEVSGKDLPGNIALSRISTEIYHIIVLLNQYEENIDSEAVKEMEKGLTALHTHLTTYKLYHENGGLSSKIEQLIQTFSREVVRYELLLQKESSNVELQIIKLRIDSLLKEFVQTIDPSINKNLENSYQQINNVRKINQYYYKILMFGGIIILILTIILSTFISNLFSKPLRTLHHAVRKITDGELDISLPVNSKDEIGDLSSAFNNMTQNLSSVQHQLLQEQSQLENRVIERTAELEASNDTLKDTIDELNQTQARLIETEKIAALGGLVAGVAHEINTPLGICITAGSDIEDKIHDLKKHYQADEITSEYFEDYLLSAESMSKLFNTNLKFSAELINEFKKMAADQFSSDWDDINLHDYISSVIDDLQNELKEHAVNIEIVCDKSLNIYTSLTALYQIITTLISNSLTHAFEKQQPQKQITITVHKEENNIQFLFQDNGKGISDEDLQQIFDPFFTTRRGEREYSGLGLSIIYNLISSTLNGKIKVQSTIGEGTIFSVDIPVMPRLEIDS